ncbi:hypothetical protein VPH35_098038 [Triticum aestivum]
MGKSPCCDKARVKRGAWSREEDAILTTFVARWSAIAAKLPGRTDNDVKNHWSTKLKKRHVMLMSTAAAPSTPPAGVAPPATPPPALVDLEAALATVDDGGELTCEAEQLYAELMGLIEQQPTGHGQQRSLL